MHNVHTRTYIRRIIYYNSGIILYTENVTLSGNAFFMYVCVFFFLFVCSPFEYIIRIILLYTRTYIMRTRVCIGMGYPIYVSRLQCSEIFSLQYNAWQWTYYKLYLTRVMGRRCTYV